MTQDLHRYPVDGVLDLHMFRPDDTRSVLGEYLRECREKGIHRVRIIHGRGKGVQLRMVRSYLETCGCVRAYSTAQDASGWGATIAELEPLPDDDDAT